MFVPDDDPPITASEAHSRGLPVLGAAGEKPEDSTLIGDSLERVKKQLAQVPPGKTGALMASVKFKGFIPTFSTAVAMRGRGGWEIAGEGFISKVDRGGSIVAVKTW